MEFFSAPHTTRPVRLSEATRQFAWDSLHYRYGQDTMKTPAVTLDDLPDFAALDPAERYDLAIAQIARQAPLRICEGERLSGAATLGRAISHVVPATFGGEPVCGSVSHITVDFPKVVRVGFNGIRAEVEASRKAPHTEREMRFLESCLRTIDSLAVWHGRYLDALRGRPEYADNYRHLCRVPFEPAATFYEAVQSIWFTFAFLRLCGNWPGIGRIDEMLEPYYQRDLAAGVLTVDEAREILAHFFIKGCEWICGGNYGSGDAQHYQNLVLAGIGRDGRDVTGGVTFLVLDIIEELGISDFPTTVRLSARSDERLVRRVAEVIRYGGGVLAVYNEDLILRSLTQYGYSEAEARGFANDGCWEVQIPGKTYFMYYPFDALFLLEVCTLHQYAETVDFEDFETLFTAFCGDIRRQLQNWAAGQRGRLLDESGREWLPQKPCTAVSLLEEGCIRSGRSYLEGGPVYNVFSPHIGGLPDAANALYAIKKLVFDEKKLTFPAFMQVLRENWEGNEALRLYVRNEYRYFGNDNDEVDGIAARILEAFADICDEVGADLPIKTPAGVSTFGRQIEWAPRRLAAPHGFVKGAVLAGNMSPTPGTDEEGATAVIRSYCKSDLSRQVTGAALDISLLPSSVKGESGLAALEGLLRGFVRLGGYFMQVDVTDAEILRRAQCCPEEFPTLSVRVSGWNARFVTLNREWQDMIIARDSK